MQSASTNFRHSQLGSRIVGTYCNACGGFVYWSPCLQLLLRCELIHARVRHAGDASAPTVEPKMPAQSVATIRVLNSGAHTDLLALRHEILARIEHCQVVSLPPNEAALIVATQTHDVLVLCNQMDTQVADTLAVAFRRANPQGRVVVIVSAGRKRGCEADVNVDAHSPKALVTAICSYPATCAHLTHDRRLVFAKTDKWSGWTCERCCWNRPQSPEAVLDAAAAERIQAAFDAHSCEAFAHGT